MTLYIIGIGLGTEKDITMRGLEIVNKCDEVYLERYTSLLQCSFQDLAKFYGREITLADRTTAENGMEKIVEQAKTEDVAFLVIGDAFSATTHIELFRLAKENNIKVEVVHNASILTAVGITGLQLYKFGKTTSIPFLDDFPQLETPYHIIKANKEIGAHTLCLLDIKEDKERFMTVPQSIEVLQDIEKRLQENVITDDLFVVGCARLGTDNIVKAGLLKEIKKEDFGAAPHCLIIPGKMHFSEEEILQLYHSGE
jgi:diphthine methyl ester synthase